MRQLKLVEHRRTSFPRSDLSEEQALVLLTRFGNYLDITFPSPRTADAWEISSHGWIGAFPVDPTLQIIVLPKVPVANLGRMLQWAYELPVEMLAGIVQCATMSDLYEHLVRELARRTMRLARQGLHHEYRTERRELGVVRGRLDVPRLIRRPVVTSVPCRVSERTGDVVENRAIAYTLDRVLRSGLCSYSTQAEVRAVHRLISAIATAEPISGRECGAIRYSRLTERYREAHTICRLLLDSAGPVAQVGDTDVVPFLLSMPRLFERFIANWLAAKLGHDYRVRSQVRRSVGSTHRVDFYIDLIIQDHSGQTVCVLDTKYKDAALPLSSDLAQIGYYALLERCRLGGLVVPTAGGPRWEGRSGTVETFQDAFDLGRDLDASGDAFIAGLLPRLTRASTRAMALVSNERA